VVNARQTRPLAPSWAPGVATAAIFVTAMIAGLVWHSDRLPTVDAWAVRELAARSDWMFWTARAISVSLACLAVVGALALATFAGVALRWRDAVLLSLAAPASAFAVQKVLKSLVARRAPGSSTFHYPSGHLAVTTAVALSLVLVVRLTRTTSSRIVATFASLLVLAMALARLVETAHLLSDVIGGVATGVAMTLATALLLDSRLLNRRATSPPP
jgi:membrane-associated phospholipid phosphatase